MSRRYKLGEKRLSREESRMVDRGRLSGYAAARYGGTVLERLHPASACPYPNEGRPRVAWMAGRKLGEQEGEEERARIRESYLAGLEQLERGT